MDSIKSNLVAGELTDQLTLKWLRNDVKWAMNNAAYRLQSFRSYSGIRDISMEFIAVFFPMTVSEIVVSEFSDPPWRLSLYFHTPS